MKEKCYGLKWYQLKEEQQEYLTKMAFIPENEDGFIHFKGSDYIIIGQYDEDGRLHIEEESILSDIKHGEIDTWLARIKSVRHKANLTQAKMSEQTHIPTRTIKDWERGVRTPSNWVADLVIEKLNAIINGKSMELSDDEDQNLSWSIRIKTARHKAGLTQARMGEKMRIPLRTIKDWERGVRTPPTWAADLIIEKLNFLARNL